MAFTSDPLVELVSDGLVRVYNNPMTEVDFGLGQGASGTIKLATATLPGDVALPEAFMPRDYANSAGALVTLQDSIQVELTFTGQDALSQPVRVVKTNLTPEDFTITLTNDSIDELAAVEFELYVRFH